MNIQIKTSGGIVQMPIETKLLADRKIFIQGEINHDSAVEFVKQLLILCKEDKDTPIDILINSPGGEITAGLLMYDVLQSCKTPIRMFCLGSAYSMAALIFASGKHGCRYMLEHSEVMLHEPLLGNRVGGNASSIKSISESLMDTRRKINKILAQHTCKTEEVVEQATAFDHYFSPEEAIEFGLADAIADFTTIMEG